MAAGSRTAALQTASRIGGEELILRLGVPLPGHGSFTRTADLTALRRAPDGTYYESNYLRGPLLYALVAARCPSAILEFGTGRGYGALCMARALTDLGLPGRVYTIDVVPPDRQFDWSYRDAAGPRTERWSRRDFWARHFPSEWRERVVEITGWSTDVVRQWEGRGLPAVELAFVDGGHDYASARHDLLAAFRLAGERFGLLADDVAERPGFGVARAVRELLDGHLPLVLVPTAWGPGPSRPNEGMVWVDADNRTEEVARLRAEWVRERTRRDPLRALFSVLGSGR